MHRRNRAILICSALVVFALGIAFAAVHFAASAFGPPQETTDVSAYQRTLQEWGNSGLVQHFPPALPPEAQQARFSAISGFLQGGGHVQVRMQLPATQVQSIEQKLKTVTTHVYSGGGFFDHYNEDLARNWPTATFHTSNNPKTSLDFPPHYTLYVLKANDTGGGSWNHGETTGVAVSTSANEVVYWAESW